MQRSLRYYLRPCHGDSLSVNELEGQLDDLPSDPSNRELKVLSKQHLIIAYLTELKASLIHAKAYKDALMCADVLNGLNRTLLPGDANTLEQNLSNNDRHAVMYDDKLSVDNTLNSVFIDSLSESHKVH